MINIMKKATITLEDLRNYCLGLPGVTEDIKWGENLCFSVGNKLFLVTSPDEYPITAAFKTTEELFHELTGRAGIKQAPYFAKGTWVHIDNIERLTASEWIELADISYNIIFSKLPKKLREQLETRSEK